MPPDRGLFTFPEPYGTEGIRIPNESDCSDCVNYVGYSYWANMNNHVGSDIIYLFVGLNLDEGGTGPILFSYDKITTMNLSISSTSETAWTSARSTRAVAGC